MLQFKLTSLNIDSLFELNFAKSTTGELKSTPLNIDDANDSLSCC